MDILLVILYNETLTSSKTIRTYLENCRQYHNKIKLVIWDNSPVRKISPEEIVNCITKFEYRHTPQNIPLSVVYNNVIESSLEYNSIFIFDQDSIVTNEYFNQIYTAQYLYPQINLFIPRIIHGSKVISPAKRFLHKGKYVYRPDISGIIKSRRFIGIMSGMNIRMRLFKNTNIKFDNNLTLYGIDIMFSIDYSKSFKSLYVIDYTLQHDLSMFSEETIEIKNKRLKSHIAASQYIAKKISIWTYLSCKIAIFIRKFYYRNKYA